MSIIQQIMNLPLFVKIAIVIAVYFMFFQKENFGPSNFDESPFVEINNKAVGLKPRPHHKGIRNRSVMKDRLMKPSKRVRIEPYRLNSIRKMQEKKKKVINKKKELQKAIREEEQENEDFPRNFEKEIRKKFSR